MIIKENLKETIVYNVKKELDKMLKEKYDTITIEGSSFFLNNKSVPFRIVALNTVKWSALVVEYGNTWEDGDCFFPEEYDSKEDLFEAILKEIEE